MNLQYYTTNLTHLSIIYQNFFRKLFNFVYFMACICSKNLYNDILKYFIRKGW